jgi:hypothetical protein
MASRPDQLRATLVKGASELCNRAWWVFLVGGIASVAFGILAFVNPGVALFVLATFFAACIVVDGAANIWGALTQRDKDGWWAILLLGALGVVVGGFALFAPPVSMTAFVYVVGFIALMIGISSLYLGWKVRQEIAGEWLLYLTGGLSVLFALLIFARPGIGGLYVVYLIASWAIIIGLLRIWFALRMRQLRERIGTRIR